MEPILSALQSALDLNQKKGWILFLFGAGMVALVRWEAIPAADTQPGWFTLFVALTAFGASILLVHFAAWVISRGKDASEKSRRENAIEADNQRFLAEGLRNLEVMSGSELEALLWVLRRGQQRFSGDIERTEATTGLLNKRILHRDPSTAARGVWLVNERVWDKRSDILVLYREIENLNEAPWDRLSGY